MTRQRFRAVADDPDHAGRICWLYRSSSADATDGRRLCFVNGRVAQIQTIGHG